MIEAMEKALNALENKCEATHPAIAALRQAIAEAEKQIETQLKMADENQRIRAELKFNGIAEAEKQDSNPIKEGWQLSVADGHSGYGVYAHMDEYPEEGAILLMPIADKQEPVAYVTGYYAGYPTIAPLNPAMVMNTGTALYAHPPKRKPLTDEEIEQCCYQTDCKANDHPATWKWTTEFAKAIEAAHGIKEKNT